MQLTRSSCLLAKNFSTGPAPLPRSLNSSLRSNLLPQRTGVLKPLYAVEVQEEATTQLPVNDLDSIEAVQNDIITNTSDTVNCETLCSLEGPLAPVEGYSSKKDLFKAVGVGATISIIFSILNSNWVVNHLDLSMIAVFIFGYIGIIIEEELAFNKSGVALLMAVSLWTIRALAGEPGEVHHELEFAASEVSEIIFFLMGAMTIVEVVDAHQGFKIITDAISTKSRGTLLWLVGVITFFMSAVLDNLTSTIVMVSLLRKLCPDPETRKALGAVVVIAANAGGAWTPIGDVTTTMLWINGQITTLPTMRDLVFPSIVSLVIPMGLMGLLAPEFKGELDMQEKKQRDEMAPRGNLVFAAGVLSLLFVPVFKQLTGLPPYLGMLTGLGFIWVLTDAIHYGEERENLQVPQALSRIDTQGILFFLGILMSIASLDAAGILKDLAAFLETHIPSQTIIASVIGIASAVVDNVPLVAATMGMYDISVVPQDDQLWQLIAYCAGTGGSILIIGSAAGVAFMGMEKVDFVWYVKKVSPWALAGYLAGIGAYFGSQEIGTFLLAQLPMVSGWFN
eukprot:TRINITY_DN1435_c0_g1_i11.p1 TRINITY_DN1435_c0_g1~~TRINITY_DN1435_c0_g1_i11.p1  ORF type:complete len:565 (+),score=84.30 TRINITY_DN1435_c0_g1_i11:935-2629(+)